MYISNDARGFARATTISWDHKTINAVNSKSSLYWLSVPFHEHERNLGRKITNKYCYYGTFS